MRAHLEQAVERYGQAVALLRRGSGEELQVQAFVQPVLKKQEIPPVAATPLGAVSEQRWLYIGKAGTELAPGDRIRCGTDCLVAQEVQTVYWRQEALYRRAILRREKEAAE